MNGEMTVKCYGKAGVVVTSTLLVVLSLASLYSQTYSTPRHTDLPFIRLNGSVISRTAIPRTVIPRTAIPRTSIPRTVIPRTAIPRTVIPRTAIPRTVIPRTAIPRTAIPRTISSLTHGYVQRSSQRAVIVDRTILPSVVRSVFRVRNSSKEVNLGDLIYVDIQMFDRYDRLLMRGGDVILLWMESPKLGAAVAGSVKDHGNGSYTGTLRSMWTGSAVIKGAVACFREGFDFIYKYFNTVGGSRPVHCIFERRNRKELTIGSPNVPVHGQYCNLTVENYGNQWYCIKPQRSGMRCEDWKGTGYYKQQGSWGMFDGNLTLAKYFKTATSHTRLHRKRYSTVRIGSKESLVPTEPCKTIPPRESWSSYNPSGFFYRNTWYLSQCRRQEQNVHQCFQGKTIILFGDSTVRQWFQHFMKTLHIQLTDHHINKLKWHQQVRGVQTQHNYQMLWIPHGTPIYFGGKKREDHRPVYNRLDDVSSDSQDIFLIHLNAHFQYHDPEAFRRSMRATAESVERLVKRAPGVKVAIKGPHYYTHRDATLGGMWGPLYEQITRDSFKNLYDRIYFVDNWSMTVAKENLDLHPQPELVQATINVFLAYVCS